ncbi:MAG: ASKHA domain-containing protein [Rhodocyclaceae bacterium]|nr:ASKHA domain-containing protein [Rhodocyclaceae bacterium]MDZ4214162.1 ASKHA domain-containing protein [Rhodocyclaceae bacterium]
MDAPSVSLVRLSVQTPSGDQVFQVPLGTSVRDALDLTELRVRAACGGSGGCGACGVTLVGGAVSPPTTAEYMKLLAVERQQGARLACQMRLQGDAVVRIDDPAPPSQWRSIPPEELIAAPGALPELAQHVYGVAVDLGTTHIRLALWNRKTGQRIATRRGPNPQGTFGADVLNRLSAAHGNPARADELAKLARTAIVQAVRDILKRDVGEVTPMLKEIGEVIVVGNTAMLALLSGRGGDTLLNPDHWAGRIDCQPADRAAFQAQWFMPHAAIHLVDAVAGFIGSDLLADLVATRLTEGAAGALLLDVGTNTEIALWDGTRLHVTAVPGGPAFEGVGLRNGMAAETGAIHRVCRTPCGAFHPASADISFETVAGAPARGFCGSGLVDAVAVLLATGQIKPSGRFAVSPGPDGFLLDSANPRTALFSQDIDTFQRAKAATAAAMAALLQRAGMGWSDIQRLCVCGAFGHRLDIANAQAIGLLPPLDPARIELFADASLAGAEIGLLLPAGAAVFAALGERVAAINLSQVSDYDDRYIDHLRLRPIDINKRA